MSIIIVILFISLLSVVVYQDFKSRAISWMLIPLLCAVGVVNGWFAIGWPTFITYLGINLSIVFINLLGVTLFISLKEKKVKNIIDSYLGLGDVLFFVVLTTIFSPINFVVFFLGSMLISTMIYGSIQLANQQKQTLIPLAGAMSAMLIITLVLQLAMPSLNFYNDIISIIE